MEDKGLIEENKGLTDNIYTPFIALSEQDILKNASQKKFTDFKGEVEQHEVRFPSELGEEHPFDFKVTEGMFKKVGFVNSVVNKFIDFIVGPGFFVESKNERAKEIIEQFMDDVNFDTLLRAWLKEALVKGNGMLEIGGKKDEVPKGLKVLDATHIFVKRDDKGVVEGYNQYTGGFKRLNKSKVIPFETFQIAHIPFNRIGDDAYGLGIVSPALITLNSLFQNTKNLNMLMDRKANSPYHVKMGGVHGGKYYKPSASDVIKMGKDFEWLNNKHEWITDGLTDIKVLDFGNIGEKFDFVLNHDKEMLIFTFQVPAVLMGVANVNEGVAQVQMDAFERRISSIQAEAEKVIENDLFRRVLLANGFDEHVEFVWGRPSSSEKFERISKMKEIMSSPLTSQSLRNLIEKDVVRLLDFDEDEYEEMLEEEEERKEIEKEREEERQQPLVPGQNSTPAQRPGEKKPQPKPAKESFIKEQEENLTSENNGHWHTFFVNQQGEGETLDTLPLGEDKHIHKITNRVVQKKNRHIHKLIFGEGKDLEIKEKYRDIEEWLGFNYKVYLDKIIEAVNEEEFAELVAITELDRDAGKLTSEQIAELKRVLEDGFRNGKSIKQITRAIEKKVQPKDLLKVEDGIIALAAGIPIVVSRAENRSFSIARSEITRTANLGAMKHFQEGGIENVRWVASFGARTCPNCEALDGRVFPVFDTPDLPLHTNCRCMTVAVTEVL